MVNYKKIITDVISTGAYKYDDMAGRIDTLYIEGKLSTEDRDELLTMVGDNATDAVQVDLYTKVVELEHRVHALEHAAVEPDYVTWVSGYTTKQGETVKYDYDKDGVLDLLRYDGGRASTALAPGKIDGWHVVDAAGEILGTWYKDVYTPVE